jgi:hypothetical protein
MKQNKITSEIDFLVDKRDGLGYFLLKFNDFINSSLLLNEHIQILFTNLILQGFMNIRQVRFLAQ